MMLVKVHIRLTLQEGDSHGQQTGQRARAFPVNPPFWNIPEDTPEHVQKTANRLTHCSAVRPKKNVSKKPISAVNGTNKEWRAMKLTLKKKNDGAELQLIR